MARRVGPEEPDEPEPDLFRMARRTDPDTSHGAAEDALDNAATNRQLALEVHRRNPNGLTDFELADLTGLQ